MRIHFWMASLVSLATFVAGAEVRLVSPAAEGVVSQQREGQKCYFARPFDERLAFMEVEAMGGRRPEMLATTSRPEPVRFAWSGGEAPYALEIFRADAAEPALVTNNLSETSLELYNFEIGAAYRWRVTDAKGEVSSTRSFYTDFASPRFLYIPTLSTNINYWVNYYGTNAPTNVMPNFRDMGGVFTADGKYRVKQNILFRSGEFDSSKSNGNYMPFNPDLSTIVGLVGPIKIELDLRGGENTEININNHYEIVGVLNQAKKLGRDDFSPVSADTHRVGVATFANQYDPNFLSREVDRPAFELFADAANYPLVFHCVAGQDRTGCYAMFLYAILGVDDETMFKGWEASAFFQKKDTFNADKLRGFMAKFGRWGTSENTLGECIVACLKEKGIIDEDLIQKIRKNLLEEYVENPANPRPVVTRVELPPDPNVAGVPVPYTGETQTTYLHSTPYYIVEMSDSAIEAGDYPVTFTLRDDYNYEWSDGSHDPIQRNFTIVPAANGWKVLPRLPLDFTRGSPVELVSGDVLYGTLSTSYTANELSRLQPGEYVFVSWVDSTASYAGLTNRIPFTVHADKIVTGTYEWMEYYMGDWTNTACWGKTKPAGGTYPHYKSDNAIVAYAKTNQGKFKPGETITVDLQGGDYSVKTFTNGSPARVTLKNGTLRTANLAIKGNRNEMVFENLTLIGEDRLLVNYPNNLQIANYSDNPDYYPGRSGYSATGGGFPYYNFNTNSFVGKCRVEGLNYWIQREGMTLRFKDGETDFLSDLQFFGSWSPAYDIALNVVIDNAKVRSLSALNSAPGAKNTGHYCISMILGECHQPVGEPVWKLSGEFHATSNSTLSVDARGRPKGMYPLIAAARFVDDADFVKNAKALADYPSRFVREAGTLSLVIGELPKSENALTIRLPDGTEFFCEPEEDAETLTFTLDADYGAEAILPSLTKPALIKLARSGCLVATDETTEFSLVTPGDWYSVKRDGSVWSVYLNAQAIPIIAFDPETNRPFVFGDGAVILTVMNPILGLRYGVRASDTLATLNESKVSFGEPFDPASSVLKLSAPSFPQCGFYRVVVTDEK